MIFFTLKLQVRNDVKDFCDRMEPDRTCVDHTFIDECQKILHGNAVSPGHVIRAGLQNGIMLAWARQEFQALLDWNIYRRWIEHSRSSPEHSDILYMVRTDGGVDAAKRLHLPLLPTPSVPVTPPPPGSLVLHFIPKHWCSLLTLMLPSAPAHQDSSQGWPC